METNRILSLSQTLASVKEETARAKAECDGTRGAALATFIHEQTAISEARTHPPVLPKAMTELDQLRAQEPQTSNQVIGNHKRPVQPQSMLTPHM